MNGSNQVVRGWVWGLRYVDELVAVLRNDDYPWANDFTHAYHVLQDANYNVLGVMSGSALVERYEYTPYGERTVLRYGGSNDPGCYAPSLTSSVPAGHYAGLCDIGHQGLMHDEESGLIYNRARHLQPQLGRFMQRDPLEYVDGASLYLYEKGNVVAAVDPSGLEVNVERQSREADPGANCKCGPNISFVLPALRKQLAERLDRLTIEDLQKLADEVFSIGGGGIAAWDIVQLRNQIASSPECGSGTPGSPCAGTVTIGKKCYAQEEANYLLNGMLARLLQDRLNTKLKNYRHIGILMIHGYRDPKPIFTGFDWSYYFGTIGRVAMFEAGYDMDEQGMNVKSKFDFSIRNCAPCTGRYTSSAGVVWYPPLVEPTLSGHVGGNHSPGVSIHVGSVLKPIQQIGEPSITWWSN